MCLPGIRSPISRSELVKTKIEFFEIILNLNSQQHLDCLGFARCSTGPARARVGNFSTIGRQLWEVAAIRQSFSDKYLGISGGSNLA